MRSKLLSYAMDFSSFLIQKIGEDSIRQIILFGSVARGEADKESDVDIFIDLVGENGAPGKRISETVEGFYASTRFKNYWNLLGVSNEIKLTIGRLENWKELQPSIASNGITLYGKFKAGEAGGRHEAIFFWENVKPDSKRVQLNRELFGFKQNGKAYPGLVERYGGDRLAKGCIVVPLEHANQVHRAFKKHGATVRIKKVMEYA